MGNEFDLEAVTLAWKNGDRDSALHLTLPHAQAGNSDAQCTMALLSIEFEEAEGWLLKAAEQDNPVAWNNLGTLYVLKDKQRALQCYKRAKELGFNCAHPYPPFDEPDKP